MQSAYKVLSVVGLLAISVLWGTIVNAQEPIKGQHIYVCNQGEATLSVIDVATNELVETIDLQELGFSKNAKPHHAIADADGSHWYVTLIGENKVLKFNRDNELVAQAELEVPGLMAMHPTEDILFVGRSMSAVNPPQSFGVVNRGGMEVEEEVDLFFSRPHALATSPDGKFTYVASLSANQILARNTETGETELTMLEGNNHVFVNFAISPDGQTMVATGQVSGKLLVFDLSDPLLPEVTDTISVNAMPWHPVYAPDGNRVYFANKGANTVTVVDMESRTVEKVIEGTGLAQPHGAALSADGKYLYVTNNNMDGTYNPEGKSEKDGLTGTVVIINTETLTIEKVIETGMNSTGIGTSNW
ncbi:beta-propeller fold lactonase family protein [Gracilimonas sp.]|uniref:beta-propeller fold lactonase family protein n=1 Tax=Gracilimonas sp. TaxID=1974203 RepID=UPI003BABD33C